MFKNSAQKVQHNRFLVLTLLHSEGPKLYGFLAALSAIGLNKCFFSYDVMQMRGLDVFLLFMRNK